MRNPDWPYKIGDLIQDVYKKDYYLVIDNEFSYEKMEVYPVCGHKPKIVFKCFLYSDYRKVA